MNSVKIAKPSIQSLLIEMRYCGQALSTGSGFLVETARGLHLVTNRHNVTGRHQETGKPLSPTGGLPNEIRVFHNTANRLGSWTGKIEPLYLNGTPRWVEHPVGKEKYDFVALPLSDLEGIADYPYDPLNPGENIMCGPADTVSVIGFPFGLSTGGALAIWATGFVASEPFLPEDPTFFVDCRSRPGQSGSAVVAYKSGGMVAMNDGSSAAFGGPVSRFLGIYSGRVNERSDLGIVWKATALAELVTSIE